MNKEREGCCNFASAFGYVIPLHVWSGRLFKCQAFSYFLEFQLSDSVAKYCLRHAIHVTNNHCLPKRTIRFCHFSSEQRWELEASEDVDGSYISRSIVAHNSLKKADWKNEKRLWQKKWNAVTAAVAKFAEA